MAQQYIAINAGVQGFKASDFTTGTSSTSGADVEIRFNDATVLTKMQLQIAIMALERYVQARFGSVPKL